MFFKRSGTKHSLAIAMTGVKLGDRLLLVGCSDASLLAAISSKVGLSGRACAVMPTESDAARARRGAENAGALLEMSTDDVTLFPFDDQSFDLIVVDDQEGLLSGLTPERRVKTLQQAFRTLAPRGRIVVINRAPRAGLGALLKPAAPTPANLQFEASGGIIPALKAEGFKAARHLAERDGLSFFEGVR